MWIVLGLLASICLGLYDLSKKKALVKSDVIPILFFSTLLGACLVSGAMFVNTQFSDERFSSIVSLPIENHYHIFLKAFIVSSSWVAAFLAMKHLPITIVTPIRATAPIWTIIGAILIFGEQPELQQGLGMLMIVISLLFLSKIGKLEGIQLLKNPWVLCIFIATFIGTFSTLYDKYLLQNEMISPLSLQFWFNWYMVLIQGLVFLVLYRGKIQTYDFRTLVCFSFIGIAVFNNIADYLYFKALSDQEALVSVLSVLRRSSVLVSFLIGGALFKESNKRAKFLALSGVLMGVIVIMMT